jgi:tetratricopeptide (TPR) repeat protein
MRMRPCTLVALGLASATLGRVSEAEATPPAADPVVAEIAAELSRARGPLVITALRRGLAVWDQADPDGLEALFRAVGADPKASPGARAYARFLESQARFRRGDFAGATSKLEGLGFVRDFVLVGPFKNDNRTGLASVEAPEREPEVAGLLSKSYPGKERTVRPRAWQQRGPSVWLDLGSMLRPEAEICAYASTFVRPTPRAKGGPGAKAAARAVTLLVGARGAMRVIVNGEPVLEDAAYRDASIDRRAVTVKLGPSWSHVQLKVCGDDRPPIVALRLADERGEPATGLETTADVRVAGLDLAARWKAGAASQKTKGPLSALEELERDVGLDARPGGREPASAADPTKRLANAKPAALYALADYLATTGGDPRYAHLARDLAARAATAEPTIERLLLAAELAEDRNQRRAWLEQAATRAGMPYRDGALGEPTPSSATRPERARTLLALAELEETGPSWRAAIPLYLKALAQEPDLAPAVVGVASLYGTAGLHRTALSTLERAAERRPKCPGLLRALAQELRALGRDQEALEVETRALALRYDDPTLRARVLELAIARRDVAEAERWIARLLEAEPRGVGAQLAAARTLRSLGLHARALAHLERALEIAPEDVDLLRTLAEYKGERGDREGQLKLLRQVLALKPQARDVRDYLEQAEPPRPRPDEVYAWAPEKFLALRKKTGGDDAKGAGTHALRSLTVTTVFDNGLASRFRQLVLQPLTQEAARSLRSYSFAYQADKQSPTVRAVRVHRASGKVDEASDSYESSVNDPSIAMYTSQQRVTITLPRVEVGDVVELRYRVDDVAPRNEIADYFGEVEYLQDEHPIDSSEYVLVAPKKKALHVGISLPGVTRETKEVGDQRIERFVATSVPALASEPAMPAAAEALGGVHVSTFKTWEQVGSWYWSLAKDQLDVDDVVRRKVVELTKGKKTELDKVRAVYRYATEIPYVALELGLEGIKPRRSALTLARGWGDCKDKATLIVAMLREVGIEASLVLVRTGMRGDVGAEPASLAVFDHAIAYVPSLDLYLDGTAEHTGTAELPAMDRGAFALRVDATGSKLVRLPQVGPEASVTRRKLDLALAADGGAQFTYELSVTGVHAPSWRRTYLAEDTRRARAAREVGEELGPVELAAGRAGLEVGVANVEEPVKLKAKGKASALGRREGATLSVPASPRQRLSSELTPLASRSTDVVLPALTSREDEWVIHVPPGMKVARAPLPETQDTPFGRFSIQVVESGNKLVVTSKLAMKKTRITPAEYPRFKLFCEAVDRWFGQRVVLSR